MWGVIRRLMVGYGCTGTSVANLSKLYLRQTCRVSFTGSSTSCCQIHRGHQEPMHSAHPVWAAVFVSVAGWNPLCFTCHAAVQPSPDKHIMKTDSAPCRKTRKRGDDCLQHLSPSYACMGFCFDFHLALISPPPPQPPLWIACYFLCALASQRYERDFGPPHTTLYHTGIPLCSLTPLKHFTPLSLLGQRFQISSDTLLSLMCVPQYRFEEWKQSCGHSCHLFTPAFGQIHWSTLLHLVCFPPFQEIEEINTKTTLQPLTKSGLNKPN